MRCERFIEIIGAIDERYIVEYLESTKERAMLDSSRIKRWGAVAGILLLMGGMLARIGSHPQTGVGEGKAEIFSSYEEFISEIPSNSFLCNITIEDNMIYKYAGIYENKDSDKFVSFWITISRQDEVLTEIYYEPSYDESCEKYANMWGLDQITSIREKTIYYAYNADGGYYEAVFVNEADFYKVRHYVKSEEATFAILKDIIE